ncbi:MAG: hypothetical protein HN736_18295 [Anaerolineae bacterium]|jgi:hypothetical protein|nr:hypothetical protein [Anaerolineae bacterium]MBT4311832.1 hypothetical protein [Anaerolineae bacterium]MBT4456662.1 hypothetical protein [Anaerolineae bacterium]MBT4843324.1 hypothetical protein [Anaerolineae bacterium]MBT6062124.1 hypothetical protein [Anaerolineae bacterium]
MKKVYQPYLGIIFITLFTFACSLFSSPPIEPVPITPEIAPQEEVVPLPAPSTFSAVLPTGVVVEKDGVLSLFDDEGYTLVQANVPGLSYADESNIHIAGTFLSGGTNLPILYFSFENNNSLLISDKGQITTLISAPEFSGLAGAQGVPVVAYTTVEYAGENLISNLFVDAIQSLPITKPILTENDPQGWALVALAVDVEGGLPVGVWYSKRPWGIGGDIVFDPRRTLSYFDLKTGISSQFLGTEANPSAISADRKWLAYTNDSSVGSASGPMAIRNVETGANLSYPLQNAIDQRGAGEASFSPNNQYLAWMEGSGWQMAETPNFHSVVRVGNMNGNIIAEYADTIFLATSGLGTVQRVEPVGWFDDNTLIVMARGEHWDDAVLISVDIAAQTSRLIAQGIFAGFAYP